MTRELPAHLYIHYAEWGLLRPGDTLMVKRDPGPDTPQPRPEEDHHPMPTPDIEPDPADEEECDR